MSFERVCALSEVPDPGSLRVDCEAVGCQCGQSAAQAVI